MVNSIGLPNKGLAGFLTADLPLLAELPVPLIVSVMATSAEEFDELVGAVAERDEVAAIELNVSCPNVHSGLIVGEQPSETLALLRTLRPLTGKPLIVKLTPNVADPGAIALAAEEGGRGRGLADQHDQGGGARPDGGAVARRRQPAGSRAPRSGDRAQAGRRLAAAVEVPVVGMGGVESGADARDLLRAGAHVVAVGTASFRDPRAAARIRAELGAGRPTGHWPVARSCFAI